MLYAYKRAVFFLSRVISPMLSYAAKLEKLCFREQRKAKVDVEYNVRAFT